MHNSIIVLFRSLSFEQDKHTISLLHRHALFDEIIPHVQYRYKLIA